MNSGRTAAILVRRLIRFRSTALLGVAAALAARSTGTELTLAKSPLVTPIPLLDVSCYSGGWCEFATDPNWFHRHCASDTRADNRPISNETIEVTNRCRSNSGELKEFFGSVRSARRSIDRSIDRTLPLKWRTGKRFGARAYTSTEELLNSGSEVCDVRRPHEVIERVGQAVNDTLTNARNDSRIKNTVLDVMAEQWDVGFVQMHEAAKLTAARSRSSRRGPG